MALAHFTSDNDDDTSDEQQDSTGYTPPTEKEQKQSTKQFIAAKIADRVEKNELDISVSDGRVEGDAEDVAMLFARMTMDFGNAELDNLIND